MLGLEKGHCNILMMFRRQLRNICTNNPTCHTMIYVFCQIWQQTEELSLFCVKSGSRHLILISNFRTTCSACKGVPTHTAEQPRTVCDNLLNGESFSSPSLAFFLSPSHPLSLWLPPSSSSLSSSTGRLSLQRIHSHTLPSCRHMNQRMR